MTRKLAAALVSATLWLSAGLSVAAAAQEGGTAKENELVAFLAGFKTLKADFEQATYDQNGRELQSMLGSLVIQRPGRFRWDYQTPYEQLIIADGQKVWFYDVDLEQVTVKPQAQALGNTPGELLSRGGALAENFDVQFSYVRNGLNWYSLEPKARDATFERLSLGMAGGLLLRMEVLDSFGQLTEFYLDHMEVNVDVDPALFKFTPPDGVDVIDETR